MANPIYNALGGNHGGTPNIMKQIQNFKNQMQGKNPNEEIQRLLQSGKISQEQLNRAQQMAHQISGMFK